MRDAFYRLLHRADAGELLVVGDIPEWFLGIDPRDRISFGGKTGKVVRILLQDIILRLNKRGQPALVEFALPMANAVDLLELDQHD